MEPQLKTRDSPEPLAGEEAGRWLLHRIAEGDRAAFRELYTMYYHTLLNFIRRLTGRLDLAEEGVNDVMLVVWTNSGSFRGRSKVSTWILGIAYHKANKLLERSRRWTGRFKAADFDDCVEYAHSPAARADDGDLRTLLARALERLSPEQRAVVELAYFSDRSYEEIAAITASPVNTVKTRMFHARAKLRKWLPALGMSEPFA